MDLLQVKFLAVAALGVASFICGLIPLKMRKCISSSGDPTKPVGKRRELIVTFLLCFGAGVLLAAVMLHMLPEIREGFERARSLKNPENASHADLHSDHDHLEHNHADHLHMGHDHSGHSHVDHDHSDHLHNHDMHLENSQDSPNSTGKSETDDGHDHEGLEGHHDHAHEGHDHESDKAPVNTHDEHGHDHHPAEHGDHDHEHNHSDHNHEHHHDEHNHHAHDHSNDTRSMRGGIDEPIEVMEATTEQEFVTTDIVEETTVAMLRRRTRQLKPDPETVLPEAPSEENHEHTAEAHTHHVHGEDEHNHEEHHHNHSYPLTELVICLGFFIVYFIEEIVHWAFSINHHGHSHGIPGSGAHSHLPVQEEEPKPLRNGVVATESSYKKGLGRRAAWRPAHAGVDNPVFVGEKDPAKWTPESTDSSQENRGRSYSSMNLATCESLDAEVKEKRTCLQIMMENVRSLLMVVALSLHSSFEGLAIGLQENTRDTWYLTLAVAAHKLVIHFCVGMELIVIGANVKTIILYMVVMSLTNPVGAAIGMFLTHDGAFYNDPDQLFLITTLQAFSAGTILYVTFFEILERERSKPGGRFTKFFALLIGFAFLAVIENFGGHSHGPSEHSH